MKIKCAFEKNFVPICFAADNNFMPYTAVTIQSIIECSNKNTNYDINILYTDISEEYIQKTLKLKKDKANISIRFINISEEIGSFDFYTKSVYTGTKYSKEAYYRILIPSLMPDYEKVIYLDGDMVAITDVAELYNIDIGDNMIGATRDYAGCSHYFIEGKDRLKYRRDILGIENVEEYFISSTLIFNVAEFNKRYTGAKLMEFCASREWRQHDQDVLNVICQNSIKIIDSAWSVMEDYGENKFLPQALYNEFLQGIENPKIIHYAGPRKPWRNPNTMFCDYFWKTTYQTPFFDLIFNQTGNIDYREYILKSLTGNEYSAEYIDDDCILSNSGYFIGELSKEFARVEILRFDGNVLTVSGNFFLSAGIDEKNVTCFIKAGEEFFECNSYVIKEDFKSKKYLFEKEFKFDFKKSIVIQLAYSIDGINKIINRNLKYGKHCSIGNDVKNQYFYSNKCVFVADKEKIVCKKCSTVKHFVKEIKYLTILFFKGRIKGVLSRIYYHLFKNRRKKEVWILSDRVNKADDNGESFFEYLVKNKKKEVKPVFVISKKCEDYKRIKKLGKVVEPLSFKHKLLYLTCDKIVSSSGDEFITNTVSNLSSFRDIIADKKFVFLQHGVTKDDLSGWLNKFNKNVFKLITTTRSEYNSILYGDYFYSKNEVVLTGFPRYDKLENNPKNKIVVMPSWRRYLVGRNINGVWEKRSNFKNSNYFNFYNALLNNEKLLSASVKYGYKIEFLPHPIIYPSFIGEYVDNGKAAVLDTNTRYNKVFSESSLLVTDYSSVAFDFAYLRKPVVYCQFDKEEFFQGTHTYVKGYFEYEKDGFGEVCYDLQSTVNTLIEYMKNGCKLKPEYAERIENTFPFNDKKNCERVFNEIYGK